MFPRAERVAFWLQLPPHSKRKDHWAYPSDRAHQFVEADGIRFAYRRFANRRAGVTIDIPLLFFMHFTGTMDHWDPALTDGFAQDREVILFKHAGVSSSSGEVPTSIEEMARHAPAFIHTARR